VYDPPPCCRLVSLALPGRRRLDCGNGRPCALAFFFSSLLGSSLHSELLVLAIVLEGYVVDGGQKREWRHWRALPLSAKRWAAEKADISEAPILPLTLCPQEFESETELLTHSMEALRMNHKASNPPDFLRLASRLRHRGRPDIQIHSMDLG
jgi:hypothetical protein